MGYYALTKKQYSAFWLGTFLGIGILTKGPVGYLVPAGAMVVFAAFFRPHSVEKLSVKNHWHGVFCRWLYG